MKKMAIAIGFLLFAGNVFATDMQTKKVKVEIGDQGFKPAQIEVKKGENLILMITRTTDSTCVKELKNASGSKQVELPLNKEVKFEFGQLDKPGKVKILCGMDMTAGVVAVQ